MLDQPVNNVDLGLFHARMLTLLRSTFPQTAMDIILRDQMTNGFQSVYFPPTASTVGVYYGGDNTRKIMYLDGVTSLQHATSLIDGYSAALGLQVIRGPQTWIQANLGSYLGMMSGNHLQFPEYLDLVGYSAGGAIAQCMAYELRRLNNTQKKKIFTYGAPRPGGPFVRDALSQMPMVRYMTPADPIPLVPPRLQDAPQMAAFLPVPVMLSWSNMVHTRGGVEIDSDGVSWETTLPTEASGIPASSLASWYFAQDGDPNNPHAMQTYIANLVAASNRASTPRAKRIELAGGEDDDNTKRREVNQARERVAAKIGFQQRGQGNVIANHPKTVLFKPTRMGRVWAVVFGDKIVAQGVREDTCRHLCRVGNDFLRSLPKQGLVDPIALASQIEQFLVYASSPESDWAPTLKTNLDLT